jgi:hypothetical protein
MKNLSEIIKNLSSRHLDEVKKILNIKSSSRNIAEIITSTLLSYHGMALVISSLSPEEMKILDAAYREKNGITFSELEKRLNLDTEKIEKFTSNLSHILLISVLKNRQKINNKLDKIYLTPEIRSFLNPIDNSLIYNYFNDINNIIESKDFSKCKTAARGLKKSSIEYIEFIYNAGGIIALEEFNDFVQAHQAQTSRNILSDLIQNRYIYIYHDLIESGKTFIILNKKIFIALITDAVIESKRNINIHNRYYLLLNLLKSYDIVSTFGLFLTKQKEFRKIDIKHLDDSMIKLHDMDGTEFEPGKLTQLSLYLLFIQNCISINNDSVIISFKNIERYLDNPLEWLLNIIKLLHDLLKDNTLLETPFDIPEYNDLILIIDLIHRNTNNTYKFIESVYFVKIISQLSGGQFINIKQIRQKIKKNFQICMRFMCISGIIEIVDNCIKLSDIGLRIAEKLHIKDINFPEETSDKNQKDIKKIYLNSNLILITPKKEIPSDALYHILTHTDIVVDDVILHTRISRESILTSLKRGMSNDMFFYILKKYLKTEIPNNLNFLISEWVSQTIRLKIFNAAVLYANQQSFIDKIAHSKIKSGILKRISSNYAIIDRKYMDKLIKMAKENDAVINLFDEDAGFD